VSTDVIESTRALESYKLVVAPYLYLLKPGVVERLRQFVEQGGNLVLTCLSGVVTESNLYQLGGLPGGGLRELCGVWAEEVDYLYEGQSQHVALREGNSLGLSGAYQTGRICEVLHAEGAEVLATVTTDYYAGHPVLTRNRVGKGSVFYLGAFLGENFQEAFTDALIEDCGITPVLPANPPRGVGVQLRTDGEVEFVFIQNFSNEPQRVELDKRDYRCMESGTSLSEAVDLTPWQTRVLRRAFL
jgi:beta-galactosidase